MQGNKCSKRTHKTGTACLAKTPSKRCVLLTSLFCSPRTEGLFFQSRKSNQVAKNISHLGHQNCHPVQTRPLSAASASFACSSGNTVVLISTGTFGARSRTFGPPICPSKISHRHHRSLPPENWIRKRRNVRHVNTPRDHSPPLFDGAERHWDEGPHWGKDDGRIQCFWGRVIRAACPLGAQVEGELLGARVTRPGEGENEVACVYCYLRKGGTEVVSTHGLSISLRNRIAAKGDQTGGTNIMLEGKRSLGSTALYMGGQRWHFSIARLVTNN
jgi:hypothetical protein